MPEVRSTEEAASVPEATAQQGGLVTLADVAPKDKAGSTVVTLEHNQTIGDALTVLSKHAILSAPVLVSPDLEDVGELHDEEPKPQLLGWVDVNDIVRDFVESISDKLKSKSMLHMMSVLEQEGPTFTERPLVSLLGGHDRRLLYEGERSMPLQDAVKRYFMGTGDLPAVHRVALFDGSGAIAMIISQMDVVRYVHAHYQEAEWCRASLSDSGVLEDGKELVAVDINTATLDALKLLVKHNRSAVAVLSPDGKLITNLSSSDLRGLQPNHFGVFALPVGEFLGLLHGAVYVGARAVDGDLSRSSSERSASGRTAPASSPPVPQHHFFAQRGQERPVPLVTCDASTRVIDVMGLMLDKHVHRVYVVADTSADQPTPVAVISTTDIMRLVAKNLV